MANIFTLENFTDFTEKINIDDLYEKKRNYDLKKLELFKKILNRIHVRIKTTAKLTNDKVCWFVVPETIIGVPKYDNAECIAYIMDILQNNGFIIRYFHPNTLFISWNHWVPTYIRNEIKKKTGINVNEYGQTIEDDNNKNDNDNDINIDNIDGITKNNIDTQNNKKYTPINSYKPSGKLVYNEDLLNRIERKIN
jgi:hypothetical protein